MTDACYTFQELAKRWKVDDRRVRSLVREGKLKAFQAGPRSERITMTEVLRFEGEEENLNARNEKEALAAIERHRLTLVR